MRILLIIPFILLISQLHGQSNTMNHLIKDKQKDLRLFINPIYQFTEVAQAYTHNPGLRAGVIINKKIIIGGVYSMMTGNIALTESNGAGNLSLRSGGLHLEYTLWPRQKVHLTIPLSAGIGQLKITDSATGIVTGDPNFYYAEPGLMIEINIWKYAKFGMGGSYRYIAKVSSNVLTHNDLTGFSAVASVKFGMFDYARQE